jgi:lipopolysaccharide export system protein LptC
MPQFIRKIVGLLLAVLLLVHVAAKAGQAGGKKKKKAAATADENAPKFNPQIPVGHSAKGITLPYFDDHGKLQMKFKIQIANRIDNEHLEMSSVHVETFDDAGKSAMTIDLPSSVLDLNTRIVSSNEPVKIKRWDFEIVGDSMQFDTQKRQGKFTGNVRMLIYNRDEMEQPAAGS